MERLELLRQFGVIHSRLSSHVVSADEWREGGFHMTRGRSLLLPISPLLAPEPRACCRVKLKQLTRLLAVLAVVVGCLVGIERGDMDTQGVRRHAVSIQRIRGLAAPARDCPSEEQCRTDHNGPVHSSLSYWGRQTS